MGPVTPEALAAAGEPRLRDAGLTRQKSRYLVDLGAAVAEGALDLERWRRTADEAVITALMALRGLGRWTADIYLLWVWGGPTCGPRATSPSSSRHATPRG